MAMPFRVSFNPAPRSLGPTRAERKQARVTAAQAAEDRCYRLVDARDLKHCRICRRMLSTDTSSMLDKVIRHHMIPRSRGLIQEPWNVLTVCRIENDRIHVKGDLRVEGDAELRDDRGRLCGVKVECLEHETWRVWKWV